MGQSREDCFRQAMAPIILLIFRCLACSFLNIVTAHPSVSPWSCHAPSPDLIYCIEGGNLVCETAVWCPGAALGVTVQVSVPQKLSPP
jgi:hypothetical protein